MTTGAWVSLLLLATAAVAYWLGRLEGTLAAERQFTQETQERVEFLRLVKEHTDEGTR